MKYKLIKWYPGLNKNWVIGMEVGQGDRGDNGTFSPCSLEFVDRGIYYSDVIDNPEYWEKIEEKSYEILSFVNLEDNCVIWNKNTDNLFYCKGGTGYEESTFLNLKSVWSVHSIKRLSDGEVFTLGDSVRYKPELLKEEKHIEFWSIDNFFISRKGELLLRAEDNLMVKEISAVEKQPTPLFKTVDSVDIKYKDDNLRFIRRGKTGCVFATIMARNPEKIGWNRLFNPKSIEIPKGSYIISYIFENKTKEEVRKWALSNGMYEEITSKNTVGLRYKGKESVSWVQYFGPDSHVKTRQTPNSELLFCVSLPKKYYNKVGFKGVLHLAHASVSYIKEKSLDTIWDSCFKRTKKILGFNPTIGEAAKTTFKN